MSKIQDELNRIGQQIVNDAKKTVPVDTGSLRDSLKYESTFISFDKFNISIYERYYGVYVNNGTYKMKARPYLTDAVKKNLPEGIDDIINIITGELLNKITQIK